MPNHHTQITTDLACKAGGSYTFKITVARTGTLDAAIVEGIPTWIFNHADSSEDLTVARNGKTIDGAAADLILKPGEHVVVNGMGTNYDIVTLYKIPAGQPFRAYREGDQATGVVTEYKIPLNAETFDPSGVFDAATNYRYTPTVAGYYKFTGAMTITVPDSARAIWVSLYKNGVEHTQGAKMTGQSLQATNEKYWVEDIIYLNGTTDYVELYYRTDVATSMTIGGG